MAWEFYRFGRFEGEDERSRPGRGLDRDEASSVSTAIESVFAGGFAMVRTGVENPRSI